MIRMHALVLGGVNELMDVVDDNDESIDNKLIENTDVSPAKEN